MGHLISLVQLCLLWHIIKIIKSHGGMLSREGTTPLCQQPAVEKADGSHVIKNISKVCCSHNGTRDGDDKVAEATAKNTLSDNGSARVINIFKNISTRLQKNKCETGLCEIVESKQPGAVTSLAQLQKQFNISREYAIVQPRFSILQQLRLDEEQQRWQQQQSELQKQQQALRLQHNLHSSEDSEGWGKADKKKKKRRRRKRRRKRKRKKPAKDKKKKRKKKPTSLMPHPAQILFASPTQKPHSHHPLHQHSHNTYQTIIKHPATATTTAKPFLQHPLIPVKKIEYILRKSTIFKNKKKEYLNHLKHVLYPFVKFIAFFTIINPFTLAAFLFSLALPVVFGFLGFMGLSFFIKPALHLLFGIKHTLNTIQHRKLQHLRRRQRLRDSRRPITIHKHYYQQIPPARPPRPPQPHRHHAPAAPRSPLAAVLVKRPAHHTLAIDNTRHQYPARAQQVKFFNPLLADVRQKLKKHKYFIPDIKGHNDSFERF